MSSTTYHSKLVAALRDRGLLQHVAFITTNYDTLLDHAIEFEGVASGRGTGSLVDYGLRDVLTADAGAHAETRTFSVLQDSWLIELALLQCLRRPRHHLCVRRRFTSSRQPPSGQMHSL